MYFACDASSKLTLAELTFRERLAIAVAAALLIYFWPKVVHGQTGNSTKPASHPARTKLKQRSDGLAATSLVIGIGRHLSGRQHGVWL